MPHHPAPDPDPGLELDRLRRGEANSQLFARMIAHDLNNLLGAVLGHASLIEAIAPPGTDIHDSAAVISQATARATDLVRQILLFSGQSTALFEPVDLATIVGEIAALIASPDFGRAPHLVSNHIHVSTVFDVSPALVTGDPAQFYQMVLNLAVNARDAMPHGGNLTFRIQRAGPSIEVAVADNGPGIPATILPRIFEPFFSANPDGRSSGLGLAIVRRVVESHGGTIHVESGPDTGTTFLIRLPERSAR